MAGCRIRQRLADPLVHVVDRLTQIMLVTVSTQQALLHKPFGDFARGPFIELAGPDHPLQDRQEPGQDVCITVLDGVRDWSSPGWSL
jgi:hypothetical protein